MRQMFIFYNPQKYQFQNLSTQTKPYFFSIPKNTGSPSMHMMLCRRRLRWLRHVRRMENGRIFKDLLYSELATGRRPVGRPALRFKDVCN